MVGVPIRYRGVLKQALTNAGWPVEDLAGYRPGRALDMALRRDRLTVRDYQPEAADSFYAGGSERGGSGVIVLPCGAGKTIVGIVAMAQIRQSTLIITSSRTSVHQWQRELCEKTSLQPAEIVEYQGSRGELGLVERLPPTFVPARIVGYEPSALRCLSVGETGVVQIDPAQRDLLIQRELAEYAEPDAGSTLRWRVTRRSVQTAIHNGLSSARIVARLSRRASHPLPPILVVAIRAWAEGQAANCPLAVSPVGILQVADSELADAIARSRVLRRHLSARLGPMAFLVKSGRASALREQLAELGLPAGQDVLVQESALTSSQKTTVDPLPAETWPDESAPEHDDGVLRPRRLEGEMES